MRIAFHAPMKPPDYPTPSGDRRMGQLLLGALKCGGHAPFIATTLRTYESAGDPARQQAVRDAAQAEADRLIAQYRGQSSEARPQLWFTYHVYYKAPDWIGPRVARAIGIPYVIAEASHAPKRNVAAWRLGHAGSELAIRSADLVLSLTAVDKIGITPLLGKRQSHLDLPPFLDPAPFVSGGNRTHRTTGPVRLLAVAMMRPGDKLESYRRLGEYLSALPDAAWTLTVVGDGPARAEVEAALAPLASDRVSFLGTIATDRMPQIYADADLYVWPAAGEAYGMAMLEAQASGLPVVAARVRGVPDVVVDGQTGFLTPEGDAPAFAATVGFLIGDPAARQAMGAAAAQFVRKQRAVENAAAILNQGFQMLRGGAIRSP